MSAREDSPTHVLVRQPDPDRPGATRDHIECLSPDTCEGWQECREPHEVDGLDASEGPDEGEEHAPWAGQEEFEFHGVTHTWRWCGAGWTVPYEGCVVAANHADVGEVWGLGDDAPVGRYPVEVDWPESTVCDISLIEAVPDARP